MTMASHGGARPGSGRKKGSVGEIKRALSEAAKAHAETALGVLVEIATTGQSEAARVSAANAILDRAYGKPMQSVELGGPDGGAVPITRIERVIIDPAKSDARASPLN